VTATTILHLNTESGWRGGEAQTLRLAEGLLARGHGCVLVSQPGSALLARAGARGLKTIPIAMRGEIDLLAARRLARVIREEKVDLLHYHTAHAVTLGTLATLFSGRRPAVAARRVSFPLGTPLLSRIKYTFRIDRVVAVSEAIRRRLIAQGLPEERVVAVHSGIDPGRFTGGDRQRFRASIGQEAAGADIGAFLVGTAGHLAAHKGIDIFLEAAAMVAVEVPSARFVIVGEGEREGALRRLAERLGLGAKAIFAGFRNDMPDVLAGLDVFVLASVSGEGSPAVLKEAMAAGTPVVATTLDDVQEIIEDARHGLLVPAGNAPALARAIVLLASDVALRSRLADAARQRAQEFSADRMVARTEQVYRSIGGGSWAR
jgi:L-malate glycosyltransferase